MKLKKIILIFMLILCCNTLYAITAKDIIAYPVPFNPNNNNQTLTIGQKSGVIWGSGYSVNVSIYDINGDLIIKKTGSGNIMWNGRNKSGRIVKPGLYILKVEVEKDGTNVTQSEYVKKIIRILIDY
jgi:flagellar hook assembly protein FlgD